MQISLSWLLELIPLDRTAEQIADDLTMLGLEIEELRPRNPGLDDRVVVGRIERVRPHPGAQRLQVCLVNAGSRSVEVVCGAPNVRVGLLAPLATPGARLPNGMVVQEMPVRGVVSQGVLCSARELGVGTDAEGLMELAPDLAPGTSIVQALGLDDVVLTLSITPNRPDCLSMLGVARELSALHRVPVKKPEILVPEEGPPVESVTSVTIEEPDLCPRYAARVIQGVQVGPSAAWVQRRLLAAGLRPINNVVDATNYVLLEMGHPLHAFDYHLLAEHRIVVRRADVEEGIVTLDGVSRHLNTEMLVIADAEKPVALAGIMGGENSEVGPNTRDVLLESAYFNPVSIRRTAKALGMQTEASYRFERGADPEGVVPALNRVAQLIHQLAGGRVCRGVVDRYPQPVRPVRVLFRPPIANEVLGTEIPASEQRTILTGLEFQVEEVPDQGAFWVTVPTFRPDVTREIDLVEEIGRVYGYARIPTTLPVGEYAAPVVDPFWRFREEVARTLEACGLYEACNYAWIPEDALDRLRVPPDDPLRRQAVILNPLSSDSARLRTTLLPSLLLNVQENHRHQVSWVALYELQKVFWPREEEDDPPEERWSVAGALWGEPPKHWSAAPDELDFFDLKGVVETLLEALGVPSWEVRRTDRASFHPGRSAEVWCGETRLGVLGEAHPEVAEAYDIPGRVYLFEMDVEALFRCARREKRMSPIPPFPPAMRDLAVLVDRSVPAGQVEERIRAAASEILADVWLFDVYEGEGVPEGKRSLAFRLEYRSPTRTLTDREVDEAQERILAALREELGAELRGSS